MYKYKKLLVSIIISIISVVIILLTPINNNYSFTVLYIVFSFYMMTNYYSNIKLTYMSHLYLFWFLITVLINIFMFGLVSIITTCVIFVLILIQYFYQEKKKEELIKALKKKREERNKKKERIRVAEPEVKKIPNFLEEDNFEEISKKLYKDMQKYFMDLNYNNLEKILDTNLYNQFKKQMNSLERSNRRAIRDNIEIFDYQINNYNNKDNMLFVSVNICVYEDKYTLNLDNKDGARKASYESCYEVEYIKDKEFKISNLKLIYSHSKKN